MNMNTVIITVREKFVVLDARPLIKINPHPHSISQPTNTMVLFPQVLLLTRARQEPTVTDCHTLYFECALERPLQTSERHREM
jgi:hypothetical protein